MANFGLEFILTFVVVFTYFSATNPHRLTKSLDPGVTVSILKCCEKFLTPFVPGWPGLYGRVDLLQGSSQPRQSVGACLCCQPVHLSLVRRDLKTGGSNFFILCRVFWVGPILGGVCGAFCFQFIFNVQRPKASIKDMEANMSMVNNSEEDMIDDLERVKQYRSNMMQVAKYKRLKYQKHLLKYGR